MAELQMETVVEERPGWRDRDIIVADAEQAFRERVESLGRTLRYRIAQGTDLGQIAEHLAASRRPALLLVNLDALGANCRDALSRLASLGSRLEIVFVSEPDTSAIRIATHLGEARRLNVTDVIEKPIRDFELRDILARERRASAL